jgi:type VI secretion system secreted protein VgrG
MGLKNYVELNLHWPDLEPAVGAPYYLVFEDGTEMTGKLDDKGYARIDNPPVQEYEVWFGEDSRKVDFSSELESNQPREVEKIDDALRSEIESFLMGAEQFETSKGSN